MAFPFFPAGAITATLVLAGTFVLFRMLLLALDRGAAELRGSIGPGLVRGVMAWVAEPGQEALTVRRPRSPANRRHSADVAPGWSLPAGASLEDETAPSGVTMEQVRRHS
jgi:hypothetical protein